MHVSAFPHNWLPLTLNLMPLVAGAWFMPMCPSRAHYPIHKSLAGSLPPDFCTVHVFYDAWWCLQIDDPLDAIAVHAFNGTWGVWAVGFFAAKNLVNTSYGYNPFTGGDREYGCFLGGSGRLLAAQIIYSIWLGSKPCCLSLTTLTVFCLC